ncbi:MAG TPA: ABC transporter permease [Vicinamibacterales bacterium]|nr:ABC transporter permease [Vicinamibacterales bacterium]
MQNLRYAVRLFVKRPGFSAVAVLTLALGIGATTTMFTVVDAVLLRPLPVRDPDRLFRVGITGRDGADFPISEADFQTWQAQNTTADAICAYEHGTDDVTGDGEPVRVSSVTTTDQFFEIVGGRAQLGRTLQRGDDRPGQPRAAVISFRFWQQRFNARQDIIGQVTKITGTPHTIVGVMPATFAFPDAKTDLWVVLPTDPPRRRGPFYLTGLAHLAPNVPADRLQSNLDAVKREVIRRYPAETTDWTLTATPLQEAMVGNVRRVLYVLLGAVAFLLLISTVNVANLLLARAATRDREIAVRAAIGAGRAQLARQLITESLVLALVAGAVGLVTAAWGTRALLAITPNNLPRINEVHMNVGVFAFALTIATVCGVLFGLAPAFRASATPLVETLKDAGRGTAGTRHRRVQRVLVVAEIALALMLSIGAGLMIRSFAALERVNPGFDSTHVLTFRLYLPRSSGYDGPKTRAFFTTLVQRLESLPGVRSAALTVSLPPHLLQMTDTFTVEGQVVPPNHSAPLGPLLFVTEKYFTTLGTPLLRGRFFAERDDQGAPLVAIINDTLAKKYFPNVDPVGRQIKVGGPERPDNPWMTVVGVVGDIKYDGLQTPVDPTFYLPFRQNASRDEFAVVRTSGDPTSIAASARSIVASLDPNIPVVDVKTMDQLMTESVAPPRFRTLLVTIFASIGLLLAAIGIYGVMAYTVVERTQEIGVRLALGASASDMVRLVLGESLTLAIVGVAIGTVGAIATTRLMASLLFGVAPTDAVTFATVAATLVATALVASWIPVRRATRVDPMVALR